MIEKWYKGLGTQLAPLVARIRLVRPGVWIMLMVLLITGIRVAHKLYGIHSADRDKMINAIGSTRYFFGIPQPSRNSSSILYLGTSDAGFGVIAADAGGKTTKMLHEWQGENTVDAHDQVSPVSPDGNSFAYFFKGNSAEYVAICNVLTGEQLARVPTRGWNVTSIIWLTPEKLICLDRSGSVKEKNMKQPQPVDHIQVIEKAMDKWVARALKSILTDDSCLTPLSKATFAWVDGRGLCELNIASNNITTSVCDGPGINGRANYLSWLAIAATNAYTIVLDTSVGNESNGWTIAYWKDGIKLRQNIYSSNPQIHYVGVGTYGLGGEILNFRLTDVSAALTNTIYDDKFGRKGALNGSVPKPMNVPGAHWQAASRLMTLGLKAANPFANVSGDTFNNGFLPFMPATGHVYSLSMTLRGISDENQWLAFGYANSALTNTSYENTNVGAGFIFQHTKSILPLFSSRGRVITEFDYSPKTDQFLLTCSDKKSYSLWSLKLENNGKNKFTQLVKDADIRGARWLNGGEGYAYLRASVLITKSRSDSGHLNSASINDFRVAPNGHELDFFGIVSNEPSAGLWRYDVNSNTLANIVPWSDSASGEATRAEPIHEALPVSHRPNIDYYVFKPVHFDRHKKYPVIIADTPYVHFENNYIQGRTWPAISLTAGGAYVVIVDRRAWFEDIQNWGNNVMATYTHLISDPTIDGQQIYLYGVSAETQYMSKLVERKPELWKGAIFLNPSGLPDLSVIKSGMRLPNILISAGANENESTRFRKFQAAACGLGMAVTIQEIANAGHFTISIEASRVRMKAMTDFIFSNWPL